MGAIQNMRLLCAKSVAVSVCLLLAACGNKEPNGQVVATYSGGEITTTDLHNELGNFQASSPQARKQAEQQALNNILARKVLAKAAEKAGINKTPEFAQQEDALHEALLVRSWQSQIAKITPPPSRTEVDKFIGDHPDLYAQRKVWVVDQVIFPASNDPSLTQALRPLNTLDEIIAALNGRGIPFKRGDGQIDALAAGPDVSAEIEKLPPGAVFIVRNGNNFVANQIRETRVTPFTGDPAIRQATALLKTQRTNEAIKRQFGSVLGEAKKKIKYAKDYQPPQAKTTPKT